MKSWLVILWVALKCLSGFFLLHYEWTSLGWGLFLLGDILVLSQLFLPRSQGLCDVVTSFDAKGKEVWLTIDDGPDPVDTPIILKLLNEFEAKATFFMIGSRALKYPELVAEVLRQGHSIGNHTSTHPLKDFWCAGRTRVYRELVDAQVALSHAGISPRFFRPPVAIKNIFLQEGLNINQLRCVTWSIRSGDTYLKKSSSIIQRVLGKLKPGTIILMHEGPTSRETGSLKSMRTILLMLRERGYACVIPTESQLIPNLTKKD